MNRTVRCLAIFAIGVGAWACKGDPQSGLDRGTISSVRANPARLFVDQGGTVEVLVDARDQMNQAVEITSVTEAVGAGITVTRDYQYQPVFDASATDEASCTAIANSSWTGAGCLIPRPTPTRLRYEVVGLLLSETSFAVTINGSTSLDIPVTVTIAVSTGTLSNETPASGEPVTVTLPSPLVFDPAVVADPTMWPGTVFIGVDDDGNPVDLATVTDLQASVVTFQFAPNIVGQVITSHVTLPFNPALPSGDLKTSETFFSPQWPTPLAITLSSNVGTGFDVITATAGPGLIFGVGARLYIGNAGVGCPADDSCVSASIVTQAADGTTIDATWPQDKTGSVYATGMAAAAAPQFPTLDSETDQTIAIAPTSLPITLTQSLPSGQGLELVRLTLTDANLQLTAASQVTSLSGGIGFMNIAVDPAGRWIDYVPVGGSTSTATISGIENIANGLIFEFPASDAAIQPPSTLAGTESLATAPDVVLPASGNTMIVWDDPTFSSNVIGLPGDNYRIVTAAASVFDYTLTWDTDPQFHADLGTWFTDAPVNNFICIADGFGGQDGGPESLTDCPVPAGAPSAVMITATFDDTPPVVQHEFVVQ